MLQQKSLGRRSPDSIEKSSVHTHSEIVSIFSNNGGTWDHLNRLPAGSTLMGNGFYLRKSMEGTWVLLLGASTLESLKNPPYLLWSIIDTVRLAAFDFDDRVCIHTHACIFAPAHDLALYPKRIHTNTHTQVLTFRIITKL